MATDFDPEDDVWVVATVYRTNSPGKEGIDRYSDVDPSDFKRSRREAA